MSDIKQSWHEVPNNVTRLYVKYADDALEAALADPTNRDGWTIQTEELGPVLVKRAGMDAIWKNLGLDKGLFPAVGRWGRGAQKLLGGPNPMTAMLLGGALGGGLGYMGGRAANALFPNYLGRNAGKRLALMGILAGAGIPGAIHLPSALKHYGLAGLFKQQPLQGGPEYPPMSQNVGSQSGYDAQRRTLRGEDSWLDRLTSNPMGTTPMFKDEPQYHSRNFPAVNPKPPSGYDAQRRQLSGDTNWVDWFTGNKPMQPQPEFKDLDPPGYWKGAADTYEELLKQASEDFQIKCAYGSHGVNYDYVGDALLGASSRYGPSAAGGAIGKLPVDQWGRVVMRDPYLDNAEKAFAAGLPAAAAAAKGSNLVTPMDVARVAANVGLGGIAGFTLAQLGVLAADAQPKFVSGMQRLGMIAGGVKGLIGMLS